MANIGKNIRQQRIQKNMTQDDLAARIHATRQTVSNYETGRSQPDIDTLTLLAQVLECDLEQLLYGKATPRIDQQERKCLLWGAGVTAALLALWFLLHTIYTPIMREHYQIPLLANYTILLCRFLWPAVLGWTVMQAAIALRLWQPRLPRWLHWLLLAGTLFYIISFFLPFVPFMTFWRFLMIHHLFPTAFLGGLVLFLMGAAVRFTKKT